MADGMFRKIVDSALDIAGDSLYDYLQVKLNKGKYAGLVTDVYGFGLDGGPYDSTKAREILIKGDNVVGFRNYDPDAGEAPLERTSQVRTDRVGKVEAYDSGRLVNASLDLFDTRFEGWGSARRLTDFNYGGKLTDTTRIKKEFVNDALRWYVKNGQRKRLMRDDANPHTDGIETIDIRTTKEFNTVLRELIKTGNIRQAASDIRDGFNWSLAKYFMVQTVAYKLFDDYVYSPLVTEPLRKLNEKSKLNWQRVLDPFISGEYRAVTGAVNRLYGLSEKEYVT